MPERGRALLLAAFLLADAAFAAVVVRGLAPGARRLVDMSQVELGEGLRLRAHEAKTDPTFRTPIVPLLEADAFLRAGPATLGAGAALVFALSALLAFALGAELGGPWGGAAAAALWQWTFFVAPRAPGFAKQFVLTPLVALAALALVRRARAPGARSSAAAGAALGISVLSRGVLAPLALLLAGGELLRAGTARARAARAAALAGAGALVLLPWWTLNAVVHRRFVLAEAGAADINIAAGAYGLTRGVEGAAADLTGSAAGADGALARAARVVAAEPGRFLAGVGRRLAFFAGLHPPLLALALLGLAWRRRDAGAGAVGLLSAYWIAIHALMPVEADYFVPLWLPLAALAAAPLSALRPALDAPVARLRVLVAALAAGLAVLLAARCGFDALAYAGAFAARPPSSDSAIAAAAEESDPWARLELARLRLREGDARAALAALVPAQDALGDAPRFILMSEWARAHDGDVVSLLRDRLPTPPQGDPYNDDRAKLPLYQAATLERLGRRADARAAAAAAREAWAGSLGSKAPQGDPIAPEVTARLRAGGAAAFASRAAYMLADEPAADADAFGRALGDAGYWLDLSRCRRASGDAAGRARALAAAAALTRDAAALREIARQEAELGASAAARAAFRRALAAEPGNAEGWSDYGVYLYGAGDKAGAETALRKALALSPGAPAAALSLGAALEARGRAPDACAVYRGADASAASDPGLAAALSEARRRACAGR